jgi:signal transduction histidine kinase
MRRRMAEIGGKFHLSSSPGGGTRVELNVPLEQEQ